MPGEKIGNERKFEARRIQFTAVLLLCITGIGIFLSFYFQSYRHPYLMKNIIDLSENWEYTIDGSDMKKLKTLQTGPKINSNETITLYKKLDIPVKEAAILIRTNHQTVNVYLDDIPLYPEEKAEKRINPGMDLQYILLPENYLNKTLKISITSPYKLYAGRTSPVFMGTIPSLEAYTLSVSMPSVILMSMCLLLGFCTIALTLAQALKGQLNPQNLALGIFAIIWALYYVCTEFIVYQFFTPFQMSFLSLGLYYTFQVPLVIFFYFSFQYYKKWLLPAVFLHTGFAAAAILLQVTRVAEFPSLLNVNNILLTGLIYTIFLAVLEAVKKNRIMILSVPFLIIAYFSMLYNFYVFYSREKVVAYSYRGTYFLFILCVLIFNVRQFFRQYYQKIKESEMLTLQNRLAKDSYSQMKNHLMEVRGLKHEINNHLSALLLYMGEERYQEAYEYLVKYSEKANAVTEVVYYHNFLINSIIGKLIGKTKEAGIEVELELKAEPAGMEAMDMYSLFNNILDNAFEASIRTTEGKVRFIRLVTGRREPYFSITCINSCNGKIAISEGFIQSSKREKGHGYGLWIIGRIAEAYNGFLEWDITEDIFTITVVVKDI